MKKDLILKTIISITLLIILLILNDYFCLPYILHIILLLILIVISLNKKVNGFLILTFITAISAFYLIIYETNIVVLLLYYLSLIILIISCYKYVFNLNNNRMKLTFKTIKIPDNNFLIAKYISGPFTCSNKNALITVDKNLLDIKVEREDGIVEKIIIDFLNIKDIVVKETLF